MATGYTVVVEIDVHGGNTYHVITAEQHADWRAGDDGTSGQDRESYSDDQDRENYSSATDPDDFLLPFVREEGTEHDTWSEAAAHVASLGGEIVNVVAVADDDDDE
jgi:hypothetical protein